MKPTQKDLQRIRETILGYWTRRLEKSQALYDSGELDYEKYDRGTLAFHNEAVSLWDCDLEEIKDRVKELDTLIDSVKHNIGVSDDYYSNYDEDGADYGIEIQRYTVKTLEQAKNDMAWDIRSEIGKIIFESIKEDGYEGKYPITPDCKILKLFEDGTIDFETLAKLTYTDCKLY